MAMIQTRMNRHLAAMFLYLCLLVLGGNLSAQGTVKVFPFRPFLHHVDLDKDLLIVYAYSHLYAQSLTTGEQLWLLPFDGNSVAFNDNDLLLGTGNRIQLHDKTTGRLRKYLSNKDARTLRHADFIGDSAWVQAIYDTGTIIFTPEGQALRPPVPGDAPENMRATGWMPDGKTLLLTNHVPGKDSSSTLSAHFWEPTTNQIQEGYSFASDTRKFLVYLSPGGKAVLLDNSELRLVDARTGDTLRDLGKSGPQFTDNGYMLSRNKTGNGLIATFLETGDTVANISREGHTFKLHIIKDHGKSWVLSSDNRHHWWLWPLETGAEPRLIWEPPGGEYTPGGFWAFRLPYGLFITGRNSISAYRLDGMEHKATWRASEAHEVYLTKYVCMKMRHVLAQAGHDDPQHGDDIELTHVYVVDNPEPLLEVPGRPCGISADGRYCVVQVGPHGPVHLVEVESGAVRTVVESGANSYFASVAFSPDNRFLAVSFSRRLVIITLGGDYPQREVQAGIWDLLFSPDGTYFAGGGPSDLFLLNRKKWISGMVPKIAVFRTPRYVLE